MTQAARTSADSDSIGDDSATSASRRCWFRLVAVLLGLSLFPLAEFACFFADVGRPELHDDPFVGFSAIHPLFVASEDGERFEIAQSRLKFFVPDSFARAKPRNGRRIFCFGGSTVQGRPWSIDTSFTSWLRIGMQQAAPIHEWEVINCGGISYASYRLVPIVEECLAYEPDLLIICTGHNEFLEDRSYSNIKNDTSLRGRVLRAVHRSRAFTVASTALRRWTGTDSGADYDKAVMSSEVKARLDFKGGLAEYKRDDGWHDLIVRHYEVNLRRMLALAESRGVPVILVQPPSNLRDSPPFKSVLRSTLSDDERLHFRDLLDEAHQNASVDAAAAIELLEECLSIDSRHAMTLYELGKLCEARRRFEEAREWFLAARDEDICPLRMTTKLEETMQRVAAERGIPFLNAHELLESHSRDSILGDDGLVDHIHPSFRSHQLIAEQLADLVGVEFGINLPDGWLSDVRPKWQTHFESLHGLYFLRGKRSLESLRLWAAGRVGETPDAEPATDGEENANENRQRFPGRRRRRPRDLN